MLRISRFRQGFHLIFFLHVFLGICSWADIVRAGVRLVKAIFVDICVMTR